MRFVDRKSIQAPASLLDAKSPAAKERQRAQKHYGQTPLPPKAFEFRAYKSEDVVEALEALFACKCAYCETKMCASQPVDVEHYRPKAAVAEDPAHSGYWWLALEWDNLLSSCIDCNRERKQYLVELSQHGAPVRQSKKQLAGKKAAFPIRGQARARTPLDDLTLEDPLLIDPTRQDPEDHLRWNIDALALPVVVPRNSSEQGDASIKVYGLNRHRLVEERGSLLTNLAVEYENLRIIFGHTASMRPGKRRTAELAKALEQLEKFRRHGKETERYSAVAKVFVAQAEARIRAEFVDALADAAN